MSKRTSNDVDRDACLLSFECAKNDFYLGCLGNEAPHLRDHRQHCALCSTGHLGSIINLADRKEDTCKMQFTAVFTVQAGRYTAGGA